MKTNCLAGAAALAMLLAAGQALAEKPFDPNDYKPCELNAVRGSPEDFKNKQVSIQAVYTGMRSDFPPYMESMGFKDDKYILVITGGFRGFQGGGMPLIAKKSSEMKDALTEIKEGTKVLVYGKVKKFQHSVVNRNTPDYYLDVDKVEELEKKDGQDAAKKPAKDASQDNAAPKLDGALPKPPKDYGKPK